MKNTSLFLLLCSAFLSACGGGGGGSNAATQTAVTTPSASPAPTATPVPTATPAPTPSNILRGNDGDLTRYMGIWTTGCVMKRVTPIVFNGVSMVLTVSAVVNNKFVSATMVETDYGQNNLSCTGAPIGTPKSYNFSFEVTANAPITGTTFQGFADQALVKITGSTDSTIFYAFDPKFSQLRMNTSTDFTAMTVVYKKQ
jgi:hypothetical protein